MIILGVDPGQVTGICLYNVVTNEASLYQDMAFTAVHKVWSLLERKKVDTVAIERYVIGPRTLKASRQYDALHVTGAIRFKCQQLDIPYAEYGASESKRLIDDDRLKDLGYYRPGKGHSNDATRQALAHLAMTQPHNFAALVTS